MALLKRGRGLRVAKVLTSQSTTESAAATGDVQTLNGVPVDQIISPNGSLRPGIIQQIFKAFESEARKNLVPDSDIKFGSTYWTLSGLAITAGASPKGGNAFTFAGTGAASGNKSALSDIIDVAPGQTLTLSGSIDATNCSGAQPFWGIYSTDGLTQYQIAAATLGKARRTSCKWVVPAGVTQVIVVAATDNTTVANATKVTFSEPQFEVGAQATSYTPNLANDTTGYLKAGAAAIDLSSGIHLNVNQDHVADGATYGRMKNTSLTGNDYDFAKGGVNKILDNIGDGPNYARPLATRLNAGRPVIDFSENIHANKTADYIAESGGRKWAAESGAVKNWSTLNDDGGKPVNNADRSPIGLTNIVFQPAPTDTSTPWGWCTASANESITAHMYGANTYAPVLGYFELDYVDNGRAYVSRDRVNPHKFTCRGGETVYLECDFDAVLSSGLSLFVIAFHADGTYSYVRADASGSGWTHAGPTTFTLPSDCVYFEIMVWGSYSAGDKALWSNVHVSHDSWGLTKGNGIARIGDGRNLIALNSLGLATSYVYSGGNITESYNSGDNTYSVTMAAFTLRSGGVSISYNSWTSGHLAPATTFYAALNDPTYAGGSPSLIISTDPKSLMLNDGYVYVAKFTTGASGGGGAGFTGVGPVCVGAEMWLSDKVHATRAREHTVIECADKFKVIGKRTVGSAHPRTGPRVRLVAENGSACVWAVGTPMELPDGTIERAENMLGKPVLTFKGATKIIDVQDIGPGPLMTLTTHPANLSYAAGEDPDNLMYGHNTVCQ